MDKYEYKLRAEEISSLISAGKYGDAVRIADTIDWRRVKSVSMLCTISDLYKVNRRFEESKEILLLAYERYPSGRAIVYSLCELSIKMGEFVQAVEYYKEFVRIAPRDTGRYILQYKLYEAQDVSLEERIAVLEEFKKHDYREKWAYELAYLYHRVGLTTECIEEVDEMFLWFGGGKYVMKALELKALHEPLSPEQTSRYSIYKNGLDGSIDARAIKEQDKDPIGREISAPEQNGGAFDKQPTKPFYTTPEERAAVEQAAVEAGMPSQEQMDQYYGMQQDTTGLYDTGNIRPYNQQYDQSFEQQYDQSSDQGYAQPFEQQQQSQTYPEQYDQSSEQQYDQQQQYYEQPLNTYEQQPQIMPTEVPPVQAQDAYSASAPKPVGFDTVNLQRAIAESMQQIMADEDGHREEIATAKEIFFEDKQTGTGSFKPVNENGDTARIYSGSSDLQKTREIIPDMREDKLVSRWERTDAPIYQNEVPGNTIRPTRKPVSSHFDDMLTQESDGQISMVVPEASIDDAQITGQISIDDIMNRIKDEQRANQEKAVAKRVQDTVNSVIGQYDEDVKYDLQSEMERQVKREIMNDRHGRSETGRDKAPENSYSGNVIRPTSEPYLKEGAAVAGDVVVKAAEKFFEKKGEASYHSVEETQPVNEESEEKISEDQATEETAEQSEEAESKAAECEKSESEEIEPEKTESQEIKSVEAPTEKSESGQITARKKETVVELDEDNALKDPEYTEEVVEMSATDIMTDAPADQDESSDDTDEEDTLEESVDETEEEETREQDTTEQDTTEQENQPDTDNETETETEARELDTRIRVMTPEEKELFGPYIHHRKSRKQIIRAIDTMNMSPASGNAIVTGEEGTGTLNLAKGLIKSVQASNSGFSGKVAKITAQALNRKNVVSIIDKLDSGALVVQRAADMKTDTAESLYKTLKDGKHGIIIVMEDNRKDMDRLLKRHPDLAKCFPVRVDVEALDNDSLVSYAKQYALEKEYKIDNFGMLSLHSRIESMQTIDHDVTISEVRDIVDEAIKKAEKKTVGHLLDVVLNKRFDDEDMVILTEKDFEIKK